MLPNENSVESYFDRALRKSKSEPLVPIGAIVTTGFLIAGLRAFHSGDKNKSQILMRGRIVAQAFTIIAMGFGAYLGVQPHDRPKTMEDKMNMNTGKS